MRYLTVSKFSSESGYSEAAVRSKIRDGVWLKSYVWRHAPDGRVLIDVEGYEAWVEQGPLTTPALSVKHLPRNIMRKTTGSPPPLV